MDEDKTTLSDENEGSEDHDPQKCLACRLMALLEELYPNGPEGDHNYILATLARTAGHVLVGLDDKMMAQFFTGTLVSRAIFMGLESCDMRVDITTMSDDPSEEAKNETKH